MLNIQLRSMQKMLLIITGYAPGYRQLACWQWQRPQLCSPNLRVPSWTMLGAPIIWLHYYLPHYQLDTLSSITSHPTLQLPSNLPPLFCLAVPTDLPTIHPVSKWHVSLHQIWQYRQQDFGHKCQQSQINTHCSIKHATDNSTELTTLQQYRNVYYYYHYCIMTETRDTMTTKHSLIAVLTQQCK